MQVHRRPVQDEEGSLKEKQTELIISERHPSRCLKMPPSAAQYSECVCVHAHAQPEIQAHSEH